MITAQEPTSATDERLAKWLQRFPKADADRDGILTQQEAFNFRNQLRKDRSDKKGRATKPAPTHRDLAYGPHPRNRFDLYLPSSSRSATARPLLVYFHGGGFVAGDKGGFDPTPYLDQGYAVASGNYRFVDGDRTLSPDPLHDAARMIQYLRANAAEWNLDKDRFAVSGSSAGAVITLWIGYHDDMADPDSQDPIERESTRVQCLIPINGPTNLDPRWITPNMGGPKHIHGSFPKMFGASVADSEDESTRARILETSAVTHLTADDPPTLLLYSGANTGIPLPESATTGTLIHHPFFGQHLSEKLGPLGVRHRFLTSTDPRKNGSQDILDWMRESFQGTQPEKGE